MIDAMFIIGAISLIAASGALLVSARSAIRFEQLRHCADHEDERP